MSCSGSNTSKESLTNLCESDMIVSGASSSQTNQTEACDNFHHTESKSRYRQ